MFKFLIFQITGETIGEVRAVSGMHQRKAEMARQADAFIALPGTSISFYFHFRPFSLSFLQKLSCRKEII